MEEDLDLSFDRLLMMMMMMMMITQLIGDTKKHFYRNLIILLQCPSDLLRAGRSGDRIPMGARFSAPFQTGPGAHPASCTVGTESLLELKRPGRDVDHPPPSSAEVKERVELYLYSPVGIRGLF